MSSSPSFSSNPPPSSLPLLPGGGIPVPPSGVAVPVPSNLGPDRAENGKMIIGGRTFTVRVVSSPSGIYDTNEVAKIVFKILELSGSIAAANGAFAGATITTPAVVLTGLPVIGTHTVDHTYESTQKLDELIRLIHGADNSSGVAGPLLYPTRGQGSQPLPLPTLAQPPTTPSTPPPHLAGRPLVTTYQHGTPLNQPQPQPQPSPSSFVYRQPYIQEEQMSPDSPIGAGSEPPSRRSSESVSTPAARPFPSHRPPPIPSTGISAETPASPISSPIPLPSSLRPSGRSPTTPPLTSVSHGTFHVEVTQDPSERKFKILDSDVLDTDTVKKQDEKPSGIRSFFVSLISSAKERFANLGGNLGRNKEKPAKAEENISSPIRRSSQSTEPSISLSDIDSNYHDLESSQSMSSQENEYESRYDASDEQYRDLREDVEQPNPASTPRMDEYFPASGDKEDDLTMAVADGHENAFEKISDFYDNADETQLNPQELLEAALNENFHLGAHLEPGERTNHLNKLVININGVLTPEAWRELSHTEQKYVLVKRREIINEYAKKPTGNKVFEDTFTDDERRIVFRGQHAHQRSINPSSDPRVRQGLNDEDIELYNWIGPPPSSDRTAEQPDLPGDENDHLSDVEQASFRRGQAASQYYQTEQADAVGVSPDAPQAPPTAPIITSARESHSVEDGLLSAIRNSPLSRLKNRPRVNTEQKQQQSSPESPKSPLEQSMEKLRNMEKLREQVKPQDEAADESEDDDWL